MRGDYIINLMKATKGDYQENAAKELAASLRDFQRKEKGFRGFTNMLKSGFKFLDPTKGTFSGAFDLIIDPILRKTNLSPKVSDIKLSDKYLRYGGKDALKTAKEGARDSQEDYRQKSILNALVGFGASKAGEAISGKVSDSLKSLKDIKGDVSKYGNLKDAIARETGVGGEAYADKIAMRVGGTKAIVDSLEEVGSEWSNLSSSLPMSSGDAAIMSSKYSNPIGLPMDISSSIMPSLSEGLNLSKDFPKTGGMYSSLPTKAPMQGVTPLEVLIQEQDNQWLDKAQDTLVDAGADDLTLWLQSLMNPEGMYKKGGIVQKFVDGGMVKKYGDGGSIDEGNILRGTGQVIYVKSDTYTDDSTDNPTQTLYDLQAYVWNGSEWVKTGEPKKPEKQTILGKTDYNMKKMTHISRSGDATVNSVEDLNKYQASGDVDEVADTYMEGDGARTGGAGLTEFKRTPEMAALINNAKAGDVQAQKDLAEVMRQSRPEKYETMTDDEIWAEVSPRISEIDISKDAQGYIDLKRDRDKLFGDQTILASTAARTLGADLETEAKTLESGKKTISSGAKSLAKLKQNPFAGMGTSKRALRAGTGSISSAMADLFGDYTYETGSIRDTYDTSMDVINTQKDYIDETFESDVTGWEEDQFDPFAALVTG